MGPTSTRHRRRRRRAHAPSCAAIIAALLLVSIAMSCCGMQQLLVSAYFPPPATSTRCYGPNPILANGITSSSTSASSRPLILEATERSVGSGPGKLLTLDQGSGNDANKSNSYRTYCPRCQRPKPTCLCHALPSSGPIVVPNIKILLLQHPREAKKRKRTGTVPLIGLCLKDIKICIGTKFDCVDKEEEGGSGSNNCPAALREVLDNPENAILLYPGDESMPLERYPLLFIEDEAEEEEGGGKDDQTINNIKDGVTTTTLVVIDGTWAQTQSMVQSSPCLQRIPRYMFDDETTSLFDPMRQEPAGHCTSSLEAVARALRIVVCGGDALEENAALAGADALESALRAMVDGQLKFALDEERARPRSKKSDTETDNNIDGTMKRARKIRRRRQAQLRLPQKMTEEEIEASRIRFIYVAHMG